MCLPSRTDRAQAPRPRPRSAWTSIGRATLGSVLVCVATVGCGDDNPIAPRPDAPSNAMLAMSAPTATLVASGLVGAGGSAIGPGGALFVAEDGKVLVFGPRSPGEAVVASGARLPVDVALGRGKALYALAQGEWDGVAEGSPAIPDDGSLLRADAGGVFHTILDGLDRPRALEIDGDVAWVVTLTGQVWKVEGID